MARISRRERVFRSILDRFAQADWISGAALPPVRRLQREFDVSRTTLIDALHLAEEHGLLHIVPRRGITAATDANERARALLADRHAARPRSRIAALIPEMFRPWDENVFFGGLARALQAEARRLQCELVFVDWPQDNQPGFARRIMDGGFDAAVALAPRMAYVPTLCILQQQRFPLVLFNADVPGLALPAVLIDEYGAARQIGARLAALGHRNMTMISEAFDARMLGAQHRVNGWLDFLRESQLLASAFAPVMLITQDDFYRAATRSLMTVPRHPTAVVFAYGAFCQHFLPGMAGGEVSIPETVSVASFDAVPLLPGCQRITTITPDMTRVAQCLFEMVRRILGGETRPKDIRVPMSLRPPCRHQLKAIVEAGPARRVTVRRWSRRDARGPACRRRRPRT